MSIKNIFKNFTRTSFSRNNMIINLVVVLSILIPNHLYRNYYRIVIESASKDEMISEAFQSSIYIKSRILNILSLDPIKTNRLIENVDFNKNFIQVTKINAKENYKNTIYALNLTKSRKLVNSDQEDLITEGIVKKNVSKKEVIDFNKKIDLIISKNNFTKSLKLEFLNISKILLKPTILVKIYNKNTTHFYVLLSDFLFDDKNMSSRNNSFYLIDYKGNLIASNNKIDTIFPKSIMNKENLNHILNTPFELGLYNEKRHNQNYFISFSKIPELNLIYINIQSSHFEEAKRSSIENGLFIMMILF